MPDTVTTWLILDPFSPLHWFLSVLQRVPSLALLLVFGVIAAAGPRPLADYLTLAFAALALLNILVHPISGQTIGPAVAAAIAFFTLNSRIATLKLKHRIKHAFRWAHDQIERRNPLGPPGRYR